jgi:hypothetical protein
LLWARLLLLLPR